MLFPNMSSLLRTKERLSYPVCSILIRAFSLSSHRTNFKEFENKSKNYFKSTSSEGKSVKFEKLGKWTSYDEINERFKKAKARLQAANLEASINFDNTEKSDDHKRFGNLSGDDDTEHSTVEMETTENKIFQRILEDRMLDYLMDTKHAKEQELSINDYLVMSKKGRYFLERKGQIKEDLKKMDAMILSKRQGKQIETKVSMPNIHLCNAVLYLIGSKRYIGFLDKAFDMYELMLQHGPKPNENTYKAMIKLCIKCRFSRKEDILKNAKKLLRDIQDRCIQIHDKRHEDLMNLFAQGLDSKILIDLIPFLLDEVGKKHSGSLLSIVLKSSLNDRQRGFHDAICAWRLIACRVPSIKPTLEDFRTLLLITYHCEIANEDEFERMLQKTAYPYSNEEFWNGSKRHEVKNNSPFAFRNDLNKDEHTRCTLGTDNNSNAESQLKKSTQIELSEMVELLKMDTQQKKEMRTSSNHMSFPLNVKREHKISDILNPFETLPSVISLPGRITSEDRKNLLDGIKEFRIRVHDEGGVTDKWMIDRARNTPMTIANESSLLRLGLERTAVGTELYALPLVIRVQRRCDNAAAKEMWRILEQSDKRKLVPHHFFDILCSRLDNERDVFQFLNFMQMEGIHPDIRTFLYLLRSRLALYDLSYQKKLLMEMSWLNVCPDEHFLRFMNEDILHINSEIFKQENSSREVEYTDKTFISREEFENFVAFYHDWLTMYNL